MHDKQFRHRDRHRHRREVAIEIVRQLVVKIRIEREHRAAREIKGVAVGRRLRDVLGSEDAAGAGTVVDDDLLAGHLRQLLGNRAAENIRRTAGRKADDEANRLARIILRLSGRRGEHAGSDARDQVTHDKSPQ